MSQTPASFHTPIQPPNPGGKPFSPKPTEENGFGLAGFIVSIAAMFLCGIPALIGVILSLIGLRKEPRGFAIAGLIIGLVGLVELAGASFVAFSVYQVGQNAGSFFQELPVRIQLNQEAIMIGNEWESLERLPTQEEADDLLKGKRDTMGNQIVYQSDETSFRLRAAGSDGTLETEDDIVVGPFFDVESTRAVESGFEFDETGFDRSKL